MKFRILKSSEYSSYSEKLKKFESQFNYPLGDKEFQINHGSSKDSYFSFFESLGVENVFILEHKDELLGVGCAILRTVGKQKFWYLCDFKLHKSVRGKNALTYLMIRYLVPFYLKSRKLVVVNMSPPNDNWLAKKVNSILFFLKLKIKPVYFYEWTESEYKDLKNFIPEVFSEMETYTNYGNKDIVIDDEIMPIIHIANKEHVETNLPMHKAIKDTAIFKGLENKPMFMLSTNCNSKMNAIKKHGVEPHYIGTMIFSKGINEENLQFSSIEI